MGPENTHLSPFCSRKTFPPMCFLKWVHFRVPSRAVMGATACSDVKQLFSLFPTAKLLTEFPPLQQQGCFSEHENLCSFGRKITHGFHAVRATVPNSGHLKRASSQKGWVPPLFGSLGVVGGVIYLYTNQIYVVKPEMVKVINLGVYGN